MKLKRKLSRRSFLASVTGAAVSGGALAAFGAEAGAMQLTDSDPSDPVGRGRGGGGVTDRDPSDPIGRGRGGSSGSTHTGVTDGDPTDPIGSGRGGGAARSGITDSDPSDPSGNGRGGSASRSGCSDSDPSDRGGDGRNCGTRGGGGGGGGQAYQTGRRERRYEVCWVDHPSRSNDECNIQTYSEWAITWSDGRIEYDTSESHIRRAEMTARGYTARWHRMIVNEW
ncbi:MAG TPA: hypothetical protein VN231_06675 [Allosphingosinicella sp.]|nr:hypothetical protein [Allosphingosinicella sp.]